MELSIRSVHVHLLVSRRTLSVGLAFAEYVVSKQTPYGEVALMDNRGVTKCCRKRVGLICVYASEGISNAITGLVCPIVWDCKCIFTCRRL